MNRRIKTIVESEKGFTMQDLLIACFIITLFVGIITTMMSSTFKVNAKTKLTSQMTLYAVQILEDIDKISYDDVQMKTGEDYKRQFSIPEGYDVSLNILDYGKQDVIKIIELKISYILNGETNDFTVKRLKIKEM